MTPPPPAHPSSDLKDIQAWFAGRLPDGWFTGPAEVTGDRDELMVVGTLADVELAKDADDDQLRAARGARSRRFREETREQRIQIAREAEHLFERKVSWGAEVGGQREHFTTVGMPVMTRLRLGDRKVLDTLIDAGVARSRSEALAWCVRLVGKHQQEWIDQLRDALSGVEKARAGGPDIA